MGFSEKDPKDKAKKPVEGPQLDAILPDEPPTSAAELVDDISSYQQRMEKEWEDAKTTYEKKINRIMSEFVVEGLSKMDSTEPLPDSPPQRQDDARLQDLIHQLEIELKDTPGRSAPFSPKLFRKSETVARALAWKNAPSGFIKKIQTFFRLVVVTAAIGIAFWFAVWRVVQTPLPYSHTLGPVMFHQRIYIMDWFRKILFTHKDDAGLTIIAVEALPNNLATGMALSEKTLWTLDGLDLKLNLHAPTLDHQVLSAIAAPQTKPVGLFFDGTDLWSADQDALKLFKHRGNDVEEIRDNFPLPDLTITSFFLDRNQLWILDGKSRLINVYRLQKPLLKLASYDLDSLIEKATPTGFALEGRTLLITTENPSSLIRVPLFRLRHSRLTTST